MTQRLRSPWIRWIAVTTVAACVAVGVLVHRRLAWRVARVEVAFAHEPLAKKCPVEVEVEGRIGIGGHGGTVSYRWERSDGAVSEQRSVIIHGDGETVKDRWWIDAAGKTVPVGIRLHVLAPNDAISAEVKTQVECGT